jgi:hypothetical protein
LDINHHSLIFANVKTMYVSFSESKTGLFFVQSPSFLERKTIFCLSLFFGKIDISQCTCLSSGKIGKRIISF